MSDLNPQDPQHSTSYLSLLVQGEQRFSLLIIGKESFLQISCKQSIGETGNSPPKTAFAPRLHNGSAQSHPSTEPQLSLSSPQSPPTPPRATGMCCWRWNALGLRDLQLPEPFHTAQHLWAEERQRFGINHITIRRQSPINGSALRHCSSSSSTGSWKPYL